MNRNFRFNTCDEFDDFNSFLKRKTLIPIKFSSFKIKIFMNHKNVESQNFLIQFSKNSSFSKFSRSFLLYENKKFTIAIKQINSRFMFRSATLLKDVTIHFQETKDEK